jgi:hypothetical protein
MIFPYFERQFAARKMRTTHFPLLEDGVPRWLAGRGVIGSSNRSPS